MTCGVAGKRNGEFGSESMLSPTADTNRAAARRASDHGTHRHDHPSWDTGSGRTSLGYTYPLVESGRGPFDMRPAKRRDFLPDRAALSNVVEVRG
jgi:hypothetical protein